MMKNQLAGLMNQAQHMQDNMKKAQEQLALVEVEGQSGAGLVMLLRGRMPVLPHDIADQQGFHKMVACAKALEENAS